MLTKPSRRSKACHSSSPHLAKLLNVPCSPGSDPHLLHQAKQHNDPVNRTLPAPAGDTPRPRRPHHPRRCPHLRQTFRSLCSEIHQTPIRHNGATENWGWPISLNTQHGCVSSSRGQKGQNCKRTQSLRQSQSNSAN